MDQDGNISEAASSTGPKILAIYASVLAFGCLLYLTRMYTRLRPQYKLNSSDYTISLAVAIEMVVFSILVAAITKGLGRHDSYVTPEEKVYIFRYLFIQNLLGTLVACLARISIALVLLQFDTSISWRATLWATISSQVVLIVCAATTQLLNCHPIRASWENVPTAKCFTPNQMSLCGYIINGTMMASDLTFAVMPMFFIFRLNRPLMERIFISVLMALGLCATATAVVKVYHMAVSQAVVDGAFQQMLNMNLWCRLEECCLLASASAPFLKSPIERALGRFGVGKFTYKDRKLNSIHFSNNLSDKERSAEQSQEDRGMERKGESATSPTCEP